MEQYPSLKSAFAKEDYQIELLYENGEKTLYDFKENLQHPFYQELREKSFFEEMEVVQGELVWKSGQDFCPYTLYEKSVTIE